MDGKYIKDFDLWNEHIKTLDTRVFEGFIRAREIWWCALGVNIGSEQDGKNEAFERPVLVIKKINNDLFLIAPLTTKIKIGEYRIASESSGHTSQILLSQVRVVSGKRLLRKVSLLKTNVFQVVLITLAKLVLDSPEIETPA